MTLWFAARDPETPRAAKLLALVIAAYALSPIDLIPDFIPVLGYLDEVILLPLGIAVCLAMIPEPVKLRCRGRADAWFAERRAKPRSWLGAAIIAALWLLVLAALGWWLWV